jgi:Holliday junction resolvase RusA-like endonuclease
MIKLTIPGEPIGKARPRWSPHGVYTAQKTMSYETLIKELFTINYPGFKPIEGPVAIILEIFQAIPKSAAAKKKAEMIKGKIRPVKKPDADNVLKIFGDGLQGIAYRNDTQIIEAHVYKFYSETPRAELILKELETPCSQS